MSNYKNRLEKLKKNWDSDKAVKAIQALPEGDYQFEIKRALLSESKASFNQGHLQVELHMAVVTGPLKGRKQINRVDLEAKADFDKGFPSGISRFKGLLETLKVDMPKSLDEKGLKQACAQLVGIVCEGKCVVNKKGYANVYINDVVNASAESDDDESEDDEDTDESDESEDSDDETDDDEDDKDNEDEDEDEVKEPPPKQKKDEKFQPQGKKPAGKEQPAKKDKEKKSDDDDEDWSKEFDEDEA